MNRRQFLKVSSLFAPLVVLAKAVQGSEEVDEFIITGTADTVDAVYYVVGDEWVDVPYARWERIL